VASVPDPYDVGLYEALAEAEPHSFWFRARNRLIVSTLRRHFPDARSLLELGCGTGFVLEALHAAFPALRLVGSELYEEGLAVARRRLPDVELVQLDARELPYRDEFDVVGAFDVLEHVDEDEAVLAEAHRAVRPGGGVVLLVPQHPRLWSAMDDVAHHVRRYTRRELVAKAVGAGFDVERVTSFVSSLLPAMAASRAARRLLRRPYDPVAELRPGALNGVFERILDGERRLIERGVSLPAGGSLLLVGRKRVH
jgi:SAM-dependent methyltransferase